MSNPAFPSVSESTTPGATEIPLSNLAVNEEAPQLSNVYIPFPKSTEVKSAISHPFIGIAALVASLVLHSLFLLFPVESKPEAKPVEPEEEDVRITQMPTRAQPSPQPSPKATPNPSPSVPKLSVVQRKPVPAAPQPSVAAAPPPAPQAAPETPEATQEAPANAGNPWQDFPLYPGAQPGCYGLPSCMQTNARLEDVSNYFQRELTAKRYTVQAGEQETNRRVYQVSRNGLAQFLTLFFVDGKTVYVLSEAPRTLADLGQAVEVPTALYDVLANFAAPDAGRTDFAQPEFFYDVDTRKSGVAVAKLVTGEVPDTFFDAYLRTNLFNNGFTSDEAPQNYAGGLLYTITKEELSLYINLVPNHDNSATIVVIWRDNPQ